jgi:hypothetical protein
MATPSRTAHRLPLKGRARASTGIDGRIMRRGFWEVVASAAVFVILVAGLAAMDPRVGDAVSNVFSNGAVSPFGDRVSDLADVIWSAARAKSLDHGPVLIFVTAGAALTAFMLRA